ncbi:MAG TPA: hypothetical protein VK779_07950 [Rhizomicrobium sp.]|jgi:hypothetical protein|nr:hypothetical protein [Rhizomicrobium sp.]
MKEQISAPQCSAAAASQAETASYIKDLVRSLRELADGKGQKRLAQLLAMAQQEAEALSRKPMES